MEFRKNRTIIQNEFTRMMELDSGWNDEELYIWALIHYKRFNSKFRYVKKYAKKSDENILLAKILINYFAKRYGIRYEDSLEVLCEFAEQIFYKLI
jgi:hypothetical protein